MQHPILHHRVAQTVDTPQNQSSDGEMFNAYRPLLFSIAYRMLGSAMDAEDVVQEAFLRWQQQDTATVASPKSFLTTVVTHLAIDALRSARVRREEYIGQWLPEPLVTDERAIDADPVALAESLSMAFLMLLERLTPIERAVFLLHDVFAYPFDEIAPIVGKSGANCRQIALRARRHLGAQRPRFISHREEQERLTRQFMRACASGDLTALLALLADDVTVYSDGGGKATAARRPIHGADRVGRFFIGVTAKVPPTFAFRIATINGQPAVVGTLDGQPYGVYALEVAAGQIQAIHVVLNPDKLRNLERRTGD
ncbi:MAG: RNA polymerase sigma-70 factor [Thermomicrobia bacterium]|nr:RNA polymerase sigma-70 factor [Thermomicrobia bacterium]MCA1725550.1 RNA polymerase sigma-70 factor [Thermomicrobia bacterium]